MADAFLFITSGERTFVAPCLSFSCGFHRSFEQREKPVDVKLVHSTPPATWSISAVKEWLQANGFGDKVSAAFEEAGIDGEALLGLSSDEMDSLLAGSKLGERVKLRNRLGKLASGQGQQVPLDASHLSVMLTQSSVSIFMMHAVMSDTKMDEVALVYFHRGGGHNGYGRRGQNGKPVPDMFLQQPFYALQIRNATVTSVQESGSSENPTVSVSYTFALPDVCLHHRNIKDFSDLGPALLGLHAGIVDKTRAAEIAKEEPLSLVKTQSIVYAPAFQCWELVRYGEQMVWDTTLHRAFPAEFRAIARELLLLFRTSHNPLGKPVTRDLIFYILKILGRSYCKTSPLDRWTFPDSKQEGEDND